MAKKPALPFEPMLALAAAAAEIQARPELASRLKHSRVTPFEISSHRYALIPCQLCCGVVQLAFSKVLRKC